MTQGYEVLDPGHRYRLHSLDGEHEQVLQFVKREDPERPARFPRNEGAYPGTTLQCVIRAVAQRIRYLNGQKPCLENMIILFLLQGVLWLLEKRAAVRHGHSYDHSPEYAMTAPICPKCGHTECEHEENSPADDLPFSIGAASSESKPGKSPHPNPSHQ